MQKFILIRGHQGSGKSTFAEQKAAEFKAQYPDAEVVRIENDLFITNEYGEYRWSGEAVDKAQKRGNALMTETLKIGRQNPNRNILIIHKIRRKTEDIGVVMKTSETDELWSVTTDGTNALKTISLHRDTVSGATDQDTAGAFRFTHCTRDRNSIIVKIIIWAHGFRAKINNFVIFCPFRL